MSFLQELKQDYRMTLEAYRDAKETGDKELAKYFCEDLIKIADAMERER